MQLLDKKVHRNMNNMSHCVTFLTSISSRDKVGLWGATGVLRELQKHLLKSKNTEGSGSNELRRRSSNLGRTGKTAITHYREDSSESRSGKQAAVGEKRALLQDTHRHHNQTAARLSSGRRRRRHTDREHTKLVKQTTHTIHLREIVQQEQETQTWQR